MSLKIVLAAEYKTSPLFLYDGGNSHEDVLFNNLNLFAERISGPIQVDELTLSDALKDDLISWDEEYQKTFDSEYPPASGFETAEQKKLHTERGRELAARLQVELGDAYLVEYKA